jgi:hypothetical protein
MPTIKQWEDNLNTCTFRKAVERAKAFEILENWDLFRGAYPEIHSLSTIANGVLTDRADKWAPSIKTLSLEEITGRHE